MGRKRAPLNKRQVEMVRLVCDGMSKNDVAEKFKVNPSTVQNLMKRDDVVALQIEYAKAVMKSAAPRAAHALVHQLESSNEWVVQNAATRILNYLQQTEAAEAGNTVNVTFSTNMPRPGMPEKIEAQTGTVVAADGEVV